MTFKVKRKKSVIKNTFAIKNPKKDSKKLFLEDVKKRGSITEREMLLIKRRLNDGTYKWEDVQDLQNLKITSEQTQKGLSWLKNQGWTPKGVERKNNPFGHREEEAINSFKEFRLNSFTNDNTAFQQEHGINNWIPVYDVIGTKGNFQYILKGGEVSIIG